MNFIKRASLSFILFSLICGTAFATSLDNTFVASDIYSSDFHSRLNRNFNQLTTAVDNVTTTQITDDTLTEADMADEINPRIRTYEGAACEFVYTGLVPATSATLSTTISAGTAYPRGYRCNKASSTAKTFTASKDTYVDIDQNCDFQYSEVSVGSAAPALASNSIRLAKVTTTGTAVSTVEDLRTTDCTAASFNRVRNDNKQATLANLFQTGKSYASGDNGWVQGARISYDTTTTFRVTSGSAYFANNNQYRFVSGDIVVGTGNDDPSIGASGLDTSSIGASTKYYVYLAADRPDVSSYSVTYSTSPTAPSGLTNYRRHGEIRTNSSSQFPLSLGIKTYHARNRNSEITGAIKFDGTAGTPVAAGGINVADTAAAITDNGTGDYTINWETQYATANYACSAFVTGGGSFRHAYINSQTAASIRVISGSTASGAEDQTVHVMCTGDLAQ